MVCLTGQCQQHNAQILIPAIGVLSMWLAAGHPLAIVCGYKCMQCIALD